MAALNHPLAVIFGVPGLSMSRDQAAFFREANPLGLILFKRNCQDPDQVRQLCDQFREAVGRDDAPILIDQEGGRVQRMEPPMWPAFPAPGAFGKLYRRDHERARWASWLNGNAIGALLHDHGINVDCAPIVDLPVPGSDPFISDRALSPDAEGAVVLAHAFMDGMRAAGVTPVLKHVPGYGRSSVDSHLALPVVDAPLSDLERTDFVPFQRLCGAPWAMVAHVVLTAVDPDHAVTVSRRVVEEVIRGRIGYQGILVSDCIYMDALAGTLPERCRAVLDAGNDIALSSHGDIPDWAVIAAAARPLTDASAERLVAARTPPPMGPLPDVARQVAEIERMLSA